MPARRVLLHYKLFGIKEWRTLELRREGARYVGAIPCLEVNSLAGEIVYDWVAPFDVDLAGSEVGEVDMNFVSMNARWFPFTGVAQPFLSAGVGLLVVRRDLVGFEETDWVSAGRFGGGLDVQGHIVRGPRWGPTGAVMAFR